VIHDDNFPDENNYNKQLLITALDDIPASRRNRSQRIMSKIRWKHIMVIILSKIYLLNNSSDFGVSSW
jgi:hypothetical protein